MAFDFPGAPTPGQIYSPTSGVRYQYNSPPSWKRNRQIARRRNRIVNPSFNISQQNGDASGTSNATFYPADQWFVTYGNAGLLTYQRVQAPTPNGSPNRLRITVTTPLATLVAGSIARLETPIEGNRVADFSWNQPGLTGYGQQVILRFGFKGPAGTYAAHFRNEAGDRSYLRPFTVAANVDTEVVLAIPGDTTGVWEVGDGCGLWLAITIACSTTYGGVPGWQAGLKLGLTTQTNGVATAGAVFEIYDVGLYLDPDQTAIPPKWEAPDPGLDMMECQRYWYFASHTSNAGGNSATQVVRPGMRHPVEMRAAPAIAIVGAPQYYDGVIATVTAVPYNGSNKSWLDPNFTTSGGLTAGRSASFHNGAKATIGFAVNARM